MSEGSGRRPQGSAAWGTWISFVAVMMILIGIFSVLAGLAAITDDGFITRGTGAGEIFLLSSHAVGIIWLLVGVLVIWAGWGLIDGERWARGVTVVLVCLHAVVDMLTINVHPFLSLLFIVISVAIIYGVTVKWDEARIGMGD